MTDPVASAAVLIRPDTSKFQAQLERELRAIVKATKIPPVPVTAAIAGGAKQAAAGVKSQQKATNDLVKSQQKEVAQLGVLERAELKAKAALDEETAAKIRLTGATNALVAAQERQALAPAGQRRAAAADVRQLKALQAQRASELELAQAQKTVAISTEIESAAMQQSRTEHLAATEAIQLEAKARASLERVEAAGVLQTNELAAVKAQLVQVERALADALAFETKARAGNTRSQIADAEAAVAAAAAKQSALRTTALSLVATQKQNSLLRESAGRQEQFSRAVFANSAGMLGLRGATLAASNAFIIGSIATIGFTKVVKGAAEDEEALHKITEVLGDEIGNKLAANADKLAVQLGIADDKILSFQGTVAQMAVNAKLTTDEVVNMANSLTELAPSLAIFGKTDVDQAMTALRSGLAGNVRGLRIYGFTLDNAQVKQRALANSGKELVSQLTQSEIVTARFQLIMEQSANISGLFASRQQGLAAQSAILSSNIEDLSDSIGSLLLPVIEELIQDLNFVFQGFRLFKQGLGDAKKAVEDFIPGGERTSGVLQKIGLYALAVSNPVNTAAVGIGILRRQLDQTGPSGEQAATGIQALIAAVQKGLAGALSAATAEMHRLNQEALNLNLNNAKFQVDQLADSLNRLTIAGAGPAARIGVLNKALAEAQAQEIAAINLGLPPTAAAAAREKQADIINQIEAAQNEIAAGQKAAASAASSAADDAQKALDAADARLQFEMQQAQAEQDIATAKAQATPSLRDDIREQKDQIKLINKQIEQARKIHDSELRLQTIAQLRLDRTNARIDLEKLQQDREDQLKEQRQRRRERIRERRDRLIESIKLDIDFLHENENIKGEIKRRQDLIKVLRRAQDKTKAGTLEYRKWRNAIQEQQKAIRELREAEKDRSDEGKSLAFEFLQNQQGFAANLLSNIVPGLAIQGTVGGGGPIGAPGAPPPPNLRGPLGRGLGAGAALGAGVGAAKADRTAADIGPTRGGQSTQTDLLRRILRELHVIRTGRSHPESQHQRQRGAATADIM